MNEPFEPQDAQEEAEFLLQQPEVYQMAARVAAEIRQTMPLSMTLLAEMLRERMILTEGFPENPSIQDLLGLIKNPNMMRWSKIAMNTKDPAEQDRLAREWIAELDAEDAAAHE